MLSLRTNISALAATRAADKSSRSASLAQTRLATGYRVNSAADDAAGLQIATRLKSQTSGMAVAMRNVQNDISLMQVASGAVDSIISIFSRMHDLAIQAADASSTQTDKAALQEEFAGLFQEVWNEVGTKFNGEDLFISQPPNNHAKLFFPVQMQIGEGSANSMTVNLQPQMLGTFNSLKYDNNDLETILTQNANAAIDDMAQAIDSWGALGSAMGAVSNRLEHVYQNLTNISANTQAATGRILDTDYASESAAETSAQMLVQSSTAMLKQSNTMPSLILSLVQQ
jgi:flagellin